MRVIALVNQKGGVGKTTSALCLGASLARLGKRVRVIDSDPQMSATNILGFGDDDEIATLDDLLDKPEAGMGAATVDTSWGFGLVPSQLSLAVREQSAQLGDEYLLTKAIESSDSDVDYVLIDCPPNLGRLTLGALLAATDVLLVTHSAYASLAGTSMFLSTIDRVADIKKRMNQPFTLTGVITTQVRSTIEQTRHAAELEEVFGDKLWRPFVPHTVAAEAVASRGVPPQDLGGRTGALKLALAYDDLAKKLIDATTAVAA